MSTQFFAEKVFTGKELLFNQIIVVENGRIQSVESGTPKTGMPQVTNLAPGLFDSHINGGEQFYFTERAAGRTMMSPFDAVDFDADPDWEWRTAHDDSADELLSLFDTCVDRSRRVLADLVGDRPTLDVPTAFTMKDGTVVELRRIVADLIEEYARHTGHADLIREAIDGRVGESPPDP